MLHHIANYIVLTEPVKRFVMCHVLYDTERWSVAEIPGNPWGNGAAAWVRGVSCQATGAIQDARGLSGPTADPGVPLATSARSAD